MKPCPKCLVRGKTVEIPDDQGECWPCWHDFLRFHGKKCTALDCPDHGKLNRPSLIERLREWWRWRALRKAEKKNAELWDREHGGRR